MEEQGKAHNVTHPCPDCGREMTYTGQPDIAGDIDFRFFYCSVHGLIKVYDKTWKEQA